MNKDKHLLVIPDIHNKHELAEGVIAKFPDHDVVFLGDYFDEFHDNVNDVEKTAIWLRDSLKNPRRVHLWGNHDLSYYAPIQYACPGFDELKEQGIRRVMKEEDWARLKFFHLDRGWLFTHAGYSNPLQRSYGRKFDELEKVLQKSLRTSPKRVHELLDAGMSSGGPRPFGGITWARWNRDFTSVPGLKQIMGHTPQAGISKIGTDYCVDCLVLRQFVTIAPDGKVTEHDLNK